ncbi:hypothetical protein C4901_09125 [Acidiferrobacter sp. SPIII_3]|uniref:hypothetical protein n=1 Tax=Acidiferrobacter sp. SPIII_3 TaxID=1281578 RepID=UPI000D72ACE2|nr:hypothetical protein [Acidiferrobacter sp. SPIII_3]AWP23473.1 hypothetical protein C4901_09125 [Acidiferrobacter sp. SPIII_3]
MSLKTWKQEFYPVPANSPEALATLRAAVEHSLRKWRGLRLKALLKHDVCLSDKLTVGRRRVCGQDGRLAIDSGSCALCWSADVSCDSCLLARVSGFPCDAEGEGPWRAFYRDDDPEPMIALLEKALANT